MDIERRPDDFGRGERPKLTGYRILVLGFAITIGLSKAWLAYKGQSTALNTMEWLQGVCIFLVLYWLGIYEKYAPHIAPWFFAVDYMGYACDVVVVDRRAPQVLRRD